MADCHHASAQAHPASGTETRHCHRRGQPRSCACYIRAGCCQPSSLTPARSVRSSGSLQKEAASSSLSKETGIHGANQPLQEGPPPEIQNVNPEFLAGPANQVLHLSVNPQSVLAQPLCFSQLCPSPCFCSRSNHPDHCQAYEPRSLNPS